jgi:hypothetical protein
MDVCRGGSDRDLNRLRDQRDWAQLAQPAIRIQARAGDWGGLK